MLSTNILLADPEHLTRIGLRALVSKIDGLQIVSEVNNEKDLMQELIAKSPDIVVLDYNHPTHFHPASVSKIKKQLPEARIMVITSDNNKANIYQVLELGVNSFLTKTCDETEFVDAFKALVKGEKFFCTRILDYLLEKSFSRPEPVPTTPLTPREIEIVRLIAKGLIAKEIGSELNLSTHTIYTHRKKIMRKLNISSSSELVMYALNAGIIESPLPR
ncbi:MAG: response regulator transcription factor [Cyanothece sp. SIO1E1]|nr:response regulator transcription factor [Cyanothece sp. SIO1E1]